MSQAVENLQRAKEVLMEQGWRQHAAGGVEKGNNSPVCLVGGLMKATNFTFGEIQHIPGYKAMATIVGQRLHWPPETYLHEYSIPIPTYNDEKGRTFNEVVDVIDEAIILAKQEQASP